MKLDKVLIVVDNYPPVPGGMARSAKRLVSNLKAYNSKMKIKILTIKPELSNKYAENDNPTLNINSPKVEILEDELNQVQIIQVNRLIKDKELLHELKFRGEQILTEFTPNIIIGFFIYRAGYIASYLGQRHNIPSILSIRGNDIEISGFDPNRIAMVTYALRNANVITSVSNYLAKTAIALVPEIATKTHIIFNGIDIKSVSLIPQKIPKGEMVIGFIGDGRRKKGLLVLFNAIIQLANVNSHLKWKLVVAGRISSLKNILKEKELPINMKLKIKGQLSTIQINEIYEELHLLVIPSLWDGFPNVLLEGVARKIPLLVSNAPSLREFFTKDYISYFTSEDRMSLVKSILEIRENYTTYLTKSSKAFDYLVEYYLSEKEFQRWKKAINDAIVSQ